MIKICIINNIDGYDEYESEDESENESEDIEMKEDLSDEELKTKIRKKRFNEIVDDIKETKIKMSSVTVLESPDIAQVLMKRMIRSLDKYVILHKLIKGPIKSKVNLVG